LSIGKTSKDFDPIQLAAGTKVEMEHTNNPKIAQRIAMDHLTEDRRYYKKLACVEDPFFTPKKIGIGIAIGIVAAKLISR